jgi:hypothetical protein
MPLGDDEIRDRKTEPRAFSGLLGGEERLEDPGLVLLGDAGPLSANSMRIPPAIDERRMVMRGSAMGGSASAMAWAALRSRFKSTCSISVSVHRIEGKPCSSTMST